MSNTLPTAAVKTNASCCFTTAKSASVLENPTSLSRGIKRRVVVSSEKQQPRTKKQKKNSSRRDGSSLPARVKVENNERAASSDAKVDDKSRAPRNHKVEDRICRPMVELHALDIKEPHRKYVARLAGYKDITSGGFVHAMAALKREAIIENVGRKEAYTLTEKGLSSLPHVAPPKSDVERHARLVEIVKEIAGGSKHKVQPIFDVLKDGQIHKCSDVATVTDYSSPSSGGFAHIMLALRNLGLVRSAGNGLIQITDLAFQNETVEPVMSNVQTSVKVEDVSSNAAVAEPIEPVLSIMQPNVKDENDDELAVSSKRTSRRGGSVHEKICRAFLECHGLKMAEPNRSHVAVLAGYPSAKHDGFKKALSQVKAAGLVEYPTSTTAKLTEYGMNTLPKGFAKLNIGQLSLVQHPRNNNEMHERLVTIIQNYGKSRNKMIEVFQAIRDGKVHSRADVAGTTGYGEPKFEKSFGFVKVLSFLSSLDIVEYPDTMTIQLSDIAFPYGRAAAAKAEDVKVEAELIDLTD